MAEVSEAARKIIEQAKLKVVSRENPLLADLPPWVREFRPHQTDAIKRIVDSFNRGNKVVVLEAPTGAGKTLIAESTRRMLKASAVYICSSKELQDQFAKDFDYARVLKGRNNYPTKNYPYRFKPGQMDSLSCEDCTSKRGNPCSWCGFKSNCPYEIAKKAAIASQLAVLNTSYFMVEANSIGRFSKWPLVIADEADTLESMLMGHVSVEISERRMAKYGWVPPEKVTVIESWRQWLDATIPQATDLWLALPADSEDVATIKEERYLANLVEKLNAVRKGLDSGIWVYTGKEGAVSFRPSRVDSVGESYLWRHSERFLLMSATIISAQEILDSLGFKGAWEFVGLDSTFPVENRRVIVNPVVNMSRKNEDKRGEQVGHVVAEIVARHPNDRVLVHSVSYSITKAVSDYLGKHAGLRGRPILSYTNAGQRSPTLARFLRTDAAILVAPSLDRGVDLPGDACRVQIILKCPYPYLGDRQVSARLHSRGGQTWYVVQAIRVVVQMTGRAVRSETDWATTYIVDSEFQKLYTRSRSLFPEWWRKALTWERGGR